MYVFDFEVFKYDWLVVFKDIASGEYFIFHNDNYGVKQFLFEHKVLVGFNNKVYDNYILKAILCGADNALIKNINDYIIAGNLGFRHWFIRERQAYIDTFDIKDDVQMGLSLKAIEGHLGLPIVESSVPFEIDRELSSDEFDEVVLYCKNDVDVTENLVKLRKDYLKTKLNLGRRAGISDSEALSATNAKLTAMILKAKKQERKDGRNYEYPTKLDTAVIPSSILNFFETILDDSVPDDILFKTSLKTVIGGMPCTYAWGGVHGSLLAYHERATNSRVIQNRDVSSLYPSLIDKYNYLSRNVPNPELFRSILNDRLEAKRTGDKQTTKDLKLPLNTVSGAQENKYNNLYDPLPTRSMRISGQLFLTVLTIRLLNSCRTIRLLNLNTDGLMYSVEKSELPLVDKICREWEDETQLNLETDDIREVWLKDVNNLMFIKEDGGVKTVGGYLNYGISVKGAWSINNNMVIVKKALVAYFENGTPVADTIDNCNNLLDFQLIAKAGVKYREAYHLVGDEKVPVQKVNRVYASIDHRFGKLHKVKAETSQEAKIENLPEYCVVDNENELSIEAVDKQWYIDLANKRINDFNGIKPEKKVRAKKMVAKKEEIVSNNENYSLNIFQKLIAARIRFLESNVKKSGINRFAGFDYFELSDICPVANSIFKELGMVFIVSFENNYAVGRLFNADNPSEVIEILSPARELGIISESGKNKMNALQGLGSEQTYQRRYLYLTILDITENDTVDSQLGKDGAATTKTTSKKPVSEVERADVKADLINANGNATSLQLNSLKKLLSQLRTMSDTYEPLIQNIATETENFTLISKTNCETLIIKLGEMVDSHSKSMA